MNKINLLFFLCLIAVTFSCSDDDSSTTSDDNSLVATWDLQTLDYEGRSTTTGPDGETVSVEFDGEGSDIDATVEFTADMEYTSQGSYTITIISMINGQEFRQDIAITNFLGFGTWERNGNIVTTQDDSTATSGELTIVELTDSTLVFEFTQTTVQEDYGFEITQAISGMYSFTR